MDFLSATLTAAPNILLSTTVAQGAKSPVSYEEDFEDLSSNVDLYVFNDQMVQGYRGVNIKIADIMRFAYQRCSMK